MKRSLFLALQRLQAKINARVLLTFGLLSLLTSAILGAQFLGMVPDRKAAIVQARANFAEAITASLIPHLDDETDADISAILEFVVARNNGVISAAVRRSTGEIHSKVGDHGKHWVPRDDGRSSSDHIVVPLLSGTDAWGQLELSHEPLEQEGLVAFLTSDVTKLTVTLVILCAGAFYFYLGRMLKQLDPSKAVPDHVRSALDTLTEGLLLIDPAETIVLANQSFAHMLGLPAQSLYGRGVSQIPWLDGQASPLVESASPWRHALHSGNAALKVPLKLKDAQGTIRSFLTNCAPVPGPNGKAGGVLMSLDDVTEMHQIQAELEDSKRAADDANRAKSDFLANMSHEIRTPMNAVLGFTEVLRRQAKGIDPAGMKHLDTIHRNGKHLLELINDILDLSKVEAGHFEVERIDCAVHEVIADVVEVLGVKAREKGISLSWHLQDKVPAAIQSDPSRLRQMVTNLVGNAIKFTEKGQVQIVQRMAQRTRDGKPHQVMCIDVRDSGIGIDQAKADAIFEPFVQAESSTTRRFGGTGLGLSISRKFARALGGDITVTSEIGKGSVFTITLIPDTLGNVAWIDQAQALASRQATSSESSQHWQFSGQKILVVDDSPENRELVRLVLDEVGLSIVEAENGQQAVNLVRSERFDLVLMDMHMPVMDGSTATRMLRKDGMTLPIIAFTAHALAGFEKEILEAGCSGYLTKPIVIDDMLGLLGELLGGKKVSIAPKAKASISLESPTMASPDPASNVIASPSAAFAQAPKQIQGSAVHSRLARVAKLHKVIDAFVQRMPKQLQAMKAAHARDDLNELAGLAHWLKGSGGSVGFDSFTEPARNLEYAAKAGDIEHLGPLIAQIESISENLISPLEAVVKEPA